MTAEYKVTGEGLGATTDANHGLVEPKPTYVRPEQQVVDSEVARAMGRKYFTKLNHGGFVTKSEPEPIR